MDQLNQQNYISKDRYEELKSELARLKMEGRQEVAARLKYAKELGDLSENSEYKEAREAQTVLEERIHELEELLRNVTFIDKIKKGSGGSVQVGSRVTVKKGKEVLVYMIVGSSDAKPNEGFISNESPIGRALIGTVKGDKVKVETPKGVTTYEVIDVE